MFLFVIALKKLRRVTASVIIPNKRQHVFSDREEILKIESVMGSPEESPSGLLSVVDGNWETLYLSSANYPARPWVLLTLTVEQEISFVRVIGRWENDWLHG